ncbi:MAG: protein-disulfide reductase DsbD domain-containing protein [Immundisolibacter sp.]
MLLLGNLILLSPVSAGLADLLGGRPEVLLPEQAFAPQLLVGSDGNLEVRFHIAAGYYLYRDRLRLTTDSGESLQLELPPGEAYDDPEFGRVAVLRGVHAIKLVVPARSGVAINLRYQGCAEGRLCYTPVQLRLSLPEQPL